tara:strand:+ start:1044 stop:1808 length:765 start_codon:yes stop_codon:yes gene_type:complete
MKKVSILITSFNAEKTIERSLKSSLNQDFIDYEIVVVDDGSTDGSQKIIKKFKNKKIKKFLLKKNIGRTKALNYGLNRCNSKYIAILDSDDTSTKNRLNKQFIFLEKNKSIDLVCSFYKLKRFNTKLQIISFPNLNLFKEKLRYTNLVAHSSVMYRKNAVKKNKIYNNKFLYAQDYEMILKFLKKNKIGFIPQVLTTINIDNSNMSNSLKYKKIVVFERMKLLYFSLQNFNFKFLEIINIWLTIIYLMIKYYLI